MNNQCATGCGRPADTGLCRSCLDTLLRALRDVEWLLPELDVTVARQSKASRGSIGFVTGSGGQVMPLHLGASNLVDDLRDFLSGWVHNLWEDYSVRWWVCQGCGAEDQTGERQHAAPFEGTACGSTRWEPHRHPLDLAIHPLPLSRWLLRHPSWLASAPYAEELNSEILGLVERGKRIVSGPVDRVYLGICSADLHLGDDENGDPIALCQRDLYGLANRAYVVCPDCGVEWEMQARRDHMLEAMREQLLTATELSRALPNYLDRPDDKPVTAAMIRGYAKRGRLVAHGESAASEDDLMDGVEQLRRGRAYAPRYRVGDLLDLLEAQTIAEAS
ncbi:hypothetical protein [Amycolatopsis sp. NPDC051372]|uniref:hypothetical protein n=1 Tax=Amycolatopsis sp. NPDC051372 TaxID=3155669 RepID=UPI00343F88B7